MDPRGSAADRNRASGLISPGHDEPGGQSFRERGGWSVLTISFGISALFFLFLNLGFLNFGENPGLDRVILAIRSLPVIGARGLLIGLALGALVMGLRALFGQVVENE